MSGHAPYLMPDGGRWRAQSREPAAKERKAKAIRPKDDFFASVLRLRAQAQGSEAEAAELQLLERVGARRRRRWLNERSLRDMAGPMSAADMEACFAPPPFGIPPPPSAFAQAAEHAELFEHFRNVDMDRESRALEAWRVHNAELAAASGSAQGPPSAVAQPPPAAQLAVQCWGRVSKAARRALKSANLHSVLELEQALLDFLERGDASERASVPADDPFGRLLLHGLAQFHGLKSVSRQDGGPPAVEVSWTAAGAAGSRVAPSAAPEITCTDVLTALVGLRVGEFSPEALARFVRKHVHGAETASEDYVLV